jgi:aspartate-semialdehyde dehydrogenase
MKGDRIPVGILGGTGMVGRHLAEALINHPIFCNGPIIGSNTSANRQFENVWVEKEKKLVEHYGETIWNNPHKFPPELKGTIIRSVEDVSLSDCRHIISCISPKLGDIEDDLVSKGFVVVSISPHKRRDPDALLTIVELGKDVLEYANSSGKFGFYNEVCSHPLKTPNCVVCGTCVSLDAIIGALGGLSNVSITTFQSLSGRGDAMYDSEKVVANIYPIRGTEETTEHDIKTEISKMLGNSVESVSVSAYRVPVQRGHLIDVRCTLVNKRSISTDDIRRIFENYNPLQDTVMAGGLPSFKDTKPITVEIDAGTPRPRTHVGGTDGTNGSGIVVGNISTDDDVFDLAFTVCVDNVSKGAWLAALGLLEYSKWTADNA